MSRQDGGDGSPLSSHALLADIDAKLDRAVGLGAQAVAQVDRLMRLINADKALDARTGSDLRGLIGEARTAVAMLRDARASADDDEPPSPLAGALVRKKRTDDTVSLVLHVGNARIKLSKKRIAFLFSLIGTAVGAAAHWLATLAAK